MNKKLIFLTLLCVASSTMYCAGSHKKEEEDQELAQAMYECLKNPGQDKACVDLRNFYIKGSANKFLLKLWLKPVFRAWDKKLADWHNPYGGVRAYILFDKILEGDKTFRKMANKVREEEEKEPISDWEVCYPKRWSKNTYRELAGVSVKKSSWFLSWFGW